MDVERPEPSTPRAGSPSAGRRGAWSGHSSTTASAQLPTELDPFRLTQLRDFEAYRSSSNNADLDSNDDSKRPLPGETIVLADLKAPPLLEESVAPSANDLTAALTRAKGANADVIVLHLHAASTVLAVRQARQLFPDLPVVAGSAMHQPATAALLEPAELKGVCAETAASPISATSGPMKAFADAYRAAFKTEPDAFAAAQYDAVAMLATIVADLRKAKQAVTPGAVRGALDRDSYQGLVTTYKSDGKGNMAHEAEIVCFDGTSRIPKVVERYTIR